MLLESSSGDWPTKAQSLTENSQPGLLLFLPNGIVATSSIYTISISISYFICSSHLRGTTHHFKPHEDKSPPNRNTRSSRKSILTDDDKPETLARGASNFQTHHMFRPMAERCFCRTSPVEISGQYTSLYSLNLQNMVVPSQNTVQTCRAMKSFRARCWISAAK